MSTQRESQSGNEGFSNGIQITKGDVDLITPPSTPSGETWHYQIALPFQVAPRKAAAFCNIRKGYSPGVDFEAGVDVVLFDNLSMISADHAVPLTRNHQEPNPNTAPPGVQSVMMKYPARGGFVPFDAKRADGSPHPHAGTGFAINQSFAWPLQIEASPPYNAYYYRGEEFHGYFELHQLSYDGSAFRVLTTEPVPYNGFVPGRGMRDGAMTNAIPDGDDLLLAMTSGEHGDGSGTGVMRWQRKESDWRPVSFTPVPDTDLTGEPSLIRDVDGSLLFCARGGPAQDFYDIRIWRSDDGGESWRKVVHVRGVVSASTISINQASDGTPYIAANLYQVYMHPRASHLRLSRDADGIMRGGGWTREVLCLWSLNEERTGLLPPLVVRDCRADFGFPPHGSDWRIDHPSAMTVQLADGEWHNVLGFRIYELTELTHASDPTPHTGTYLEEVISAGRAIPIWNF